MMNAALWIFATLVIEWACKTIWREYLEPWLVARSHAKAAADRADEAEERRYFGVMIDHAPRVSPNQAHIDELRRRRDMIQERIENPLHVVHLHIDD